MYQEEFMSKAYLVLLSSDKIREYIIISSTMFSNIYSNFALSDEKLLMLMQIHGHFFCLAFVSQIEKIENY